MTTMSVVVIVFEDKLAQNRVMYVDSEPKTCHIYIYMYKIKRRKTTIHSHIYFVIYGNLHSITITST